MSESRKTIALTREMMIASPPDMAMDEIDLMDQVEEIKSWDQLCEKISLRKNAFLDENKILEQAEQDLKKGAKEDEDVRLIREARSTALKRWRNVVELGELLVADDEAEARYSKDSMLRHKCANRMKSLVAEKNEIELYKEFKTPQENKTETQLHIIPKYTLRRPTHADKVISEFVLGNWMTLFTSCFGFGFGAKSPPKKTPDKEMKEIKRP